MSEGVFQTDRMIFDNQIWKQVLKFRLFFFIYGNAVYVEEGIYKGDVYIKRGQFLRSFRRLQDDLEYIENNAVKRYSLSQIKKAIDELETEKRVTTQSTTLGTLFTVLNYEQYQGFERFKEDSLERRKNGERTEKERRKNNNKKDNKEKKDKNVKKNIYSEIFETAYKIYPRPQAKADTYKNWTNLLETYTEEQLLQFAQNYTDYYNSIPEDDRPFAYGSNNFFGKKAYFEDFLEPKKWEGKPKQQHKPPNMANFTQREYSKKEHEGYFEEV